MTTSTTVITNSPFPAQMAAKEETNNNRPLKRVIFPTKKLVDKMSLDEVRAWLTELEARDQDDPSPGGIDARDTPRRHLRNREATLTGQPKPKANRRKKEVAAPEPPVVELTPTPEPPVVELTPAPEPPAVETTPALETPVVELAPAAAIDPPALKPVEEMSDEEADAELLELASRLAESGDLGELADRFAALEARTADNKGAQTPEPEVAPAEPVLPARPVPGLPEAVSYPFLLKPAYAGVDERAVIDWGRKVCDAFEEAKANKSVKRGSPEFAALEAAKNAAIVELRKTSTVARLLAEMDGLAKGPRTSSNNKGFFKAQSELALIGWELAHPAPKASGKTKQILNGEYAKAVTLRDSILRGEGRNASATKFMELAAAVIRIHEQDEQENPDA